MTKLVRAEQVTRSELLDTVSRNAGLSTYPLLPPLCFTPPLLTMITSMDFRQQESDRPSLEVRLSAG